MITANPDLCNRDGICADVCPIKIISFKDGQLPIPVPGADRMCIRCSHCVAVCPTGALAHVDMSPDACPPVRREWRLSSEQAAYFLRSRRSIRVYHKNRTVARETIDRLIETASYAPSGHNRQPLQKALALPKGHASFGAMMVGYPRHTYHRLPLRNPPVITWQ